MDVQEAIRTRRSVRKFAPDPVAPELIQAVVAAGTWAPNHRRTEPWHFYVIHGETRRAFAQVRAEISRVDLAHLDPSVAAVRIQRAHDSILRTPVLIAVTAEQGTTPEMRTDNEKATCACIQNMLLTAHSLGLGAIWRTGKLLDARVHAFIGAPPTATLVGVIYLGYPAADPESDAAERVAVTAKTTWLQ